jgi:hypothetical protein
VLALASLVQENELEELRPYKGLHKTVNVKLMMRDSEVAQLRAENEELKADKKRQAQLIQSLVNSRKGGLTENEYSMLVKEEDRAASANSDGEETEEEEEEEKDLPPTSHLCIMCKGRLDKVINVKVSPPAPGRRERSVELAAGADSAGRAGGAGPSPPLCARAGGPPGERASDLLLPSLLRSLRSPPPPTLLHPANQDSLINGPPRLPAEAFRLMLPKLDLHQHWGDPEDEVPVVDESEEEKEDEEKKEEQNPNSNSPDLSGSDDEDEKMPVVTNAKTERITKLLNLKVCPTTIRDRALDDVWVVRTMRSIVNAKAVDDGNLVAGPFTLESGLGSRRTRFPEFCHGWFVPPPEQIAKVCVHAENVHKGISTASKAYKRAVQKDVAAMQALLDEADEHRWALYYGVKVRARRDIIRARGTGRARSPLTPTHNPREQMLAQRSPPLPEASLFWNLLDETYAEDYTTFYYFCLHTVKSLADVSNQWGVTQFPHPPPNHYEFINRLEGPNKDTYEQEAGPEVGVITQRTCPTRERSGANSWKSTTSFSSDERSGAGGRSGRSRKQATSHALDAVVRMLLAPPQTLRGGREERALAQTSYIACAASTLVRMLLAPPLTLRVRWHFFARAQSLARCGSSTRTRSR